MDTDAKGQLGGIECGKEVRRRMAGESGPWRCAVCGKSNGEILKEREEMAKLVEGKDGKRKEESVPEELRLAYRDELEGGKVGPTPGLTEVDGEGKGRGMARSPPTTATSAPATSSASAAAIAPAPSPVPRPTRTVHAPVVQQLVQHSPDRSLAWIDACIYGVVAALLFMVLRKFV